MVTRWSSGTGRYSQLLGLIVAVAAALLVACNGANVATAPSLTPTPSTKPSPSATPNGLKVYVSDYGYPVGAINVFPLPLVNSSHSIATIAGDGRPFGMAFDASHRLFVTNWLNRAIQVFDQPISRSATSAFTLGVPFYPSDATFDIAGDLFVGGYKLCGEFVCGFITAFSTPVAGSSVPSFTISTGHQEINGVIFDRSGNLFATLRLGGGVLEYASPVTADSVPFEIPEVSMPIFDRAGNMYALTRDGIGSFAPPFSAAMTPVFTIKDSPKNSFVDEDSLALDSSGDLYVAGGPGTLLMYAPPISASSKPAVTIATSAYGGLAIGP
jgi:hypothetical protein